MSVGLGRVFAGAKTPLVESVLIDAKLTFVVCPGLFPSIWPCDKFSDGRTGFARWGRIEEIPLGFCIVDKLGASVWLPHPREQVLSVPGGIYCYTN